MEKLGLKLKNEYDIRLVDSRTGVLKKHIKTHNVVLNNWYSSLSNYQAVVNRLYLGTGSGVPSESDTGLFTSLGYKDVQSSSRVYPDMDYTVGWQWNFKFTENECNGLLTELGLASSTTLLTHSLFTDSEDQTMTIEKTDTDVLLVSASVYATVSWSGIFKPILYRNKNGTHKLVNPIARRSTADDYSALAPFSLRVLLVTAATNGTDVLIAAKTGFFGLTTEPLPINRLNAASDEKGLYTPASQFCSIYSTGSSSTADGYKRMTSSRILADSWNGAGTFIIRSLGVDTAQGSMWFTTPLPNHNIYPPKLLTLTKVGDGTTTDFNLGIPELMTTNVEVTVDGVTLDPSDYDFFGKDYNLSQAWPSQDTKFLDYEQSKGTFIYDQYNHEMYYLPWAPLTDDADGYQGTTLGGAYISICAYDFQQPITVSRFKCKVNGRFGTPSGTFGLYSSDDGEVWTQVATASFSNQQFDVTFSAVSARYWKTQKTDGSTFSASEYRGLSYAGDANSEIWMAFGDPKPQLRFHTAPAQDAQITVKAYCEYPVKNSNWLFDPLIVDWKISRAI